MRLERFIGSSRLRGAVAALWQYRYFVAGMVVREFRSRYSGSVLGAAWLLLAPFAMILIYTLVFANVMQARLPDSQSPFAYSIHLCAGLLPWQWFTELLSRNVGLFVDHGGLLRKSSFPRMALPATALLGSGVNFALIMVLFLGFLIVVGQWPGWALLWCLPLLVLQSALALGLGLALGVLNVFFRDVGQASGILLQFWFWLTPIVYPISALPAWARHYIDMNPLSPLAQAYQQIFSHGAQPDWASLKYTAAAALLSLLLAVWLYRSSQHQIADEL